MSRQARNGSIPIAEVAIDSRTPAPAGCGLHQRRCADTDRACGQPQELPAWMDVALGDAVPGQRLHVGRYAEHQD